MEIELKRIYEPYELSDGCRILVDRLWPRGIKKEAAKIDYWFKNVAPSSELRKWFHHQPERFEEFRHKYLMELETEKEKIQLIEEICHLVRIENITLLFAAKNRQYNHAIVLKEVLARNIWNN